MRVSPVLGESFHEIIAPSVIEQAGHAKLRLVSRGMARRHEAECLGRKLQTPFALHSPTCAERGHSREMVSKRRDLCDGAQPDSEGYSNRGGAGGADDARLEVGEEAS